jgi:cytochrome b
MKVRVWDLPLRLCHWLLVAAVATAFVSAQIGGNAMVWHGRAGLAVVGLVVFRIVWGFIGSGTARFASFVKGPAAIRAYLRGEWRGVGHNPLGALSVLALLALLAAQAASGLFANDDIAYQGHLYAVVGAELSASITGIHKLFEPIMIALVLLHVGAIAYYVKIRKDNLTIPMVTGWTDVAEPVEAPVSLKGGSLAAFAIAAAIGVAAAWAASGALLPPALAAPPVETPAF